MARVNVYSLGDAACALGVNKRVYCWGKGINNAFGDGKDAERTEATELAGLDDVIALGQGDADHACVVMGDKTIRCWGMNNLGQLGDGTSEPRFGPIAVSDLEQVSEVAHGGSATCALHDGGLVSCWGSGNAVGDPMGNAIHVRPTHATQIRVGSSHACALLRDGSLYCWGNPSQVLGFNDGTPYASPTLMTRAPDAKYVMLNYGMTCAFLRESSVRCWGVYETDIVIGRADSGCIASPIFFISGTTLRAWGWRNDQRRYMEFTPARVAVQSIACGNRSRPSAAAVIPGIDSVFGS